MLDVPHWPFLLVALPFCLYATWSDLKFMIIPNWLCLGLVGAFIVVGLVLLPLDVLGWQLLAGVIVLAATFLLNSFGIMGGGDAKMLAALAPYIAGPRVSDFLLIFAVCLLGSLALHRIAGAIPAIRRATPDWVSWNAGRNFPMGTGISAALVIYLAMMASQT